VSSVFEEKYKGYTLQELLEMPMDQLVKLLPSRARRTLLRIEKNQRYIKLLEKVRKARKLMQEGKKVRIRTHCRDAVILPEMVGLTIEVYNGREYIPVKITLPMVGHYLGEFAPTTKRVVHGAPGLKATRSSMYVPLK